ncbi:MAG: prephenate dehydrogenase [Thermodesulfovibrionales bacterium]
MEINFNKTSIIGVGLIGASLGLAIRKKGLCEKIYGFGRNERNLLRAKEKGIIDSYSLDLKEVCEDSDLIVLSTPVGVFLEMVKNISPFLKKGSIIIDVGSVKGRLVYEIESLMPEGVFYIGTHPIAGSDKSGIDDARAELFEGARCIITPTDRTDRNSLERISQLWKNIGCHVELMDPYRHDEIYGAVSHLPHIIAYSLVNTIGEINDEFIKYSGQGFKDATRIALSSPELWRDIVVYNRENLLRFLEVFRAEIEKIDEYLKNNKAEAIRENFQKARQLRERIR